MSVKKMNMPKQFGLRRLFVATTCIAIPFGLLHWLGTGTTAAILFIAAWAVVGYFAKPYILDSRGWTTFSFGLSGLFLTCCLLPGFQGSACTGGRRSQCQNSLKMIGLGLQCYADVNGCFPPAYIADASGRPMHS